MGGGERLEIRSRRLVVIASNSFLFIIRLPNWALTPGPNLDTTRTVARVVSDYDTDLRSPLS